MTEEQARKIYEVANELDHIRTEIEGRQERFLRENGWTHTCETPGSVWLWQKQLPDGRIVLVNTSCAWRFLLDDVQAEHPDMCEGCGKVCEGEYCTECSG